MRDQEIYAGFAKVEKKMNKMLEEHYILSIHFSAMQRVLRDKGYVTAEEHTAELLKIQRDVQSGKIKPEVQDDKQGEAGVKEAVPNPSNPEGQVLPNKELPNSEVGVISTPPAV
jgi:hemerythrin